jgi:type II secretory pathway pseudopilin PulG
MIELMIAMVTMGVILGAVAIATQQGTDAYQTGRVVGALEAQAQRTVNRVLNELREAGRAGLVPDPLPPFGSQTLDFQLNTGWVGTVVQWGTPTRVAFEMAPGEVDDGIDNNGNGVVDDGSVVWRSNPGQPDEQRIVWSNNVREFLEGEVPNGLDDNGNGLIDEGGLCFEANGNTVIVRLTLEQVDDNGGTITRTVESAITLRN